MSHSLISIIIPVYNSENYLCKCIDSVLSQSFTDWECIIVDDGSTDKSPQICDEYAKIDSRIIVLHQKNCGVSSARDKGIEVSKGRWITFVDADDYLEQGFFNVSFSSKADLIIQKKQTFGIQVLKEAFEPFYYNGYNVKEFLRKNMTSELLRAPWGKFFRASIIKENHLRFNPRHKLGEDALFMLDYLPLVHSIEVVSSAYYMYRLNSDYVLRYKLSLNDCIEYIHDLLTKYIALGLENNYYLSFNYRFYTGIVSSHRNKKELRKWFNHPDVKYLKKQSASLISLKVRIKYFFMKYI